MTYADVYLVLLVRVHGCGCGCGSVRRVCGRQKKCSGDGSGWLLRKERARCCVYSLSTVAGEKFRVRAR